MYGNLEAEIARRKLKKSTIAKKINRSCGTLTSKLSGKYAFTYDEAVQIQESFFPEFDLKELFEKSEQNN